MSSIIEYLAKLEQLLPDHEKDNMRPGASEKLIRDAEEYLAPRKLTRELQLLYRWHDGSSTMVDDRPLFGFQFYSLSEALKERDLIAKTKTGSLWVRRFFVIGEGELSTYLATLNDIDSAQTQIFEDLIDDSSTCLFYQSIVGMVRTALVFWGETKGHVSEFEKTRYQFNEKAYFFERQKLSKRNARGIRNWFESPDEIPIQFI